MSKLRVLDLFSGIGGFSLGLERTGGFETVAFCEIDPYCQKILAKHWPKVTQTHDVTTTPFHANQADVVCGGFPCQDLSHVGPGAGLSGERSGLWRELVRAIRVVRPLYAIVENVAALLGRGMGVVCGDLAKSGYDAEWDCIPASAIGANHIRDRLWILAYPDGERRDRLVEGEEVRHARVYPSSVGERRVHFPNDLPFPLVRKIAKPGGGLLRNDDGLSKASHRIRALGNTVVPDIPEMIGHAILAAHSAPARPTEGA